MKRKLNILLIISIATVFLSFVAPENCKLLRDGKYLMKYTLPTETVSRLQINHNSFIQYFQKGDTLMGEIKWSSNCTFQLIYDNKPKRDTSEMSNLIKKSFGETLIELTDGGHGTITFRTTHVANLHITLDKGELIRLK